MTDEQLKALALRFVKEEDLSQELSTLTYEEHRRFFLFVDELNPVS